MKKLFSITLLILLVFSSCKLNKDQRKLQRASRKIEKLDRKSKRIAIEHDLTRKDTVQSIVQYITTPAKIDTFFVFDTDTVYFENENLSVQVIKDLGKYKLTALCDTIVIRDTVTTTYERIGPIRLVEKELTKWQSTMMKIGNGLFWIIVVAIILLILRFTLKKYIPLIP